MFEKALTDKFKKIFGLKKVTFDIPSDSREQECLFIEIESSRNTIKDGRQKAMVTGNARVFGIAEKLPFGYFSKMINRADPNDTKDLFFFDFEGNSLIYRDKVERSFSFIYFFDGQYDPETGTITRVTLSEES